MPLVVPRRCFCLTVFLGVWCGTAQVAPSQESVPPAKAKIAWASDFDAAMKRAKDENKPIMVAFLMDDEPANDETIDKHYTDPEIVKLSAKFVCLACCVGEHKCENGICTKFHGVTCAEHQAIEKKARARWLTGDDVATPQHVFCDPNGKVITRKIYLTPKDVLQKCLAYSLDAVCKDGDARRLVEAEKARVDKWLKDVDSRNAAERDAAIRELVVSEDPRAMPAVLRVAKSGKDDVTRASAIAALARKGNFKAVGTLAAMLGEGKAQIVIGVAKALETIQLPDPLADLLAVMKKEKRDRVRGFVLRAAARSAPGNAVVRDACIQALKGASAQLEPCAMVALGRMQSHPKIVEAVAPRLRDKNQNIRGLAVWVLGQQATDEAMKLLADLLAVEQTPEVTTVANKAMKRCRKEKVEDYDNLFTTFFSDADY